MIHLISKANQHLYAAQLWAMHRERRAQFVERNGWRDLTIFAGGEFDDYDDDAALYLLDLNDEGEVQAGVRVRPTLSGCMLADKFAHLVHPNWPSPKAEDAWEITRLFTTAAYRAFTPRHGEAVHRVVLAAQQEALARGCSRFVGILDMSVYPLVSGGPQQVRLMGLPVAYPFGIMVGAEGDVSLESLGRLREALAMEPDQPLPVAWRGPPGQPAEADALERLIEARAWAQAAWKGHTRDDAEPVRIPLQAI